MLCNENSGSPDNIHFMAKATCVHGEGHVRASAISGPRPTLSLRGVRPVSSLIDSASYNFINKYFLNMFSNLIQRNW